MVSERHLLTDYKKEVFVMSDLSEAEQQEILNSAPRGTWALLLGMAVLFSLGWGFFYFGMFLAHGPVH